MIQMLIQMIAALTHGKSARTFFFSLILFSILYLISLVDNLSQCFSFDPLNTIEEGKNTAREAYTSNQQRIMIGAPENNNFVSKS